MLRLQGEYEQTLYPFDESSIQSTGTTIRAWNFQNRNTASSGSPEAWGHDGERKDRTVVMRSEMGKVERCLGREEKDAA